MRQVLIIENDTALSEVIKEQFSLIEGFDVPKEEFSIDSALNLIKNTDFDLIIASSEVKNAEKQNICKVLRVNNINIPVLMLISAQDNDENNLFSQANEVIEKPFYMNSLIEIAKELIIKFENNADNAIPIGPYKLLAATKQLVEKETGRTVKLTEKEIQMLKFLYKAKGQGIDRETLLHEVWGYNPNITTHTLETHVYKLRQKIEEDPSNAKILLTDVGGYKLGF